MGGWRMLNRDLGFWAQAATVLMGIVAAGFVLSITREVTAPLVLALAVAVVLSPFSDFWERMGFSTSVGALASLILAIVLLGALILAFQPVVMELLDVLPGVWATVQDMLTGLRRSLQSGGAALASTAPPVPPIRPEPALGAEAMPMPDVETALWYAPTVLSQIMIFAGALFFFLLSRRAIYDYMALRLSQPATRATTALRLRAAERQVSRYFLTVTAINAGLGLATAVALHLIGMPGAAMWGLLAFVLNFVIYLGPVILAVVLTLSATASLDGAMVLAPAAAFLVLNTLEGQFVTPSLVARNLSLDPFVVFVALIFGIWLWGPIGGIVALPMLLWARVLISGEPLTPAPIPERA